MATTSLLLGISDLTLLLGTSTRTLHRMKSAELLPAAVRLGSQFRWRRDEIEQWIAAGCPSQLQWEQICAQQQAGGGAVDSESTIRSAIPVKDQASRRARPLSTARKPQKGSPDAR